MRGGDIMALAGRVLLASLFLASAFGKVTNFSSTVKFMESHGVVWSVFFCAASAALEAAAGIALVLGYYSRLGAAALAGFVVVATMIFHLGPDQRVQLLKNLAIVGGLLQVMAFGPGELSLEGRRNV